MSHSTFLPEDYVAKRAERRTNLICLSLFAIVMTAVFGAFLVTNQAWSQIKSEQIRINAHYQEAGKQIKELTELERQRDEMLHKAELAAALVERVPRSILLAELINRMPPQLGVLEFDLRSQIRQPPRPVEQPQAKTRLSGRQRAQSRQEADESMQRIEAPRYNVTLSMVGVAPTDLEVSRYLAELNSFPLLGQVTLDYSEQKEIQGRNMRQFRITMALSHNADVRQIDPTDTRRDLRNPMRDDVTFSPTGANERAGAAGQRNGRN